MLTGRVSTVIGTTVSPTGLAIHTFHGNFFVRSPDLLSLPNINPDSSFGMQLTIEDNLEGTIACCQAALLYTSSKGQPRGLCLETTLLTW